MYPPPDKWPYQLFYYRASCELTKNNNRIKELPANFKWYINSLLRVSVIDSGINGLFPINFATSNVLYVAYFYCQNWKLRYRITWENYRNISEYVKRIYFNFDERQVGYPPPPFAYYIYETGSNTTRWFWDTSLGHPWHPCVKMTWNSSQ